MVTPEFETFRRLADQGNVVPVWRALTADLETPVSAYLKLADGETYSFLFESVEGGEKIGRYTYLGASPFLRVVADDRSVEICENGRVERREGSVFDILRELTERYKSVHPTELPPFVAGAVGYAGYDCVRLIEPRIPPHRVDDVKVPDAVFMFFTTLLVFDHVKHEIYAVANVRTEECGSLEDGYKDALRQLDEIERKLEQPAKLPPSSSVSGPVEARSSMGQEIHQAGVEKAKEYILAGDIFQLVLSHRLEVDTGVAPFQIYRALRQVNPSPYLFFLQLDDMSIVGSSPEMLVKVDGRKVEYRPIAGTRPRGQDEQEDQELAADLLSDEKELAEHVMLVDLGRNDVGRVCEYGSVHVPEFEIVENYSHVMHIVSSVKGTLREDMDSFDALAACFPAGTVSGAPKVRAMEIVAELEPTNRGIYSGSVLYLDFSGNLNSCIAIRTMLVKGDKAYIQAGGGIVADSVPRTEWEETMNKARALLRAIEKAREL